MVFIIPGVAASGYPGVEATGGTETTYTSGGITYKVHTFSSVGTTNFVVSANGTVDYLIVAGGGSGGAGRASPFTEWPGGGGAGGFVEGTFNVTTGTYPIVVGAGGAGVSAFSPSEAPRNGNNGSNSTAFSKTAIGGGAGAAASRTGFSGGSGGGASGRQDATPDDAVFVGGTGQQPGSASGGFGNNGGKSENDSTNITQGGGGGGAGSAGDQGNIPGQGGTGNGGSGKASSISGTSITYAAGGAGSNGSNGTGYGNPGSGTAALRGGGTTVNGFNGIVIVRYQLF
jgi:hypothetical protein